MFSIWEFDVIGGASRCRLVYPRLKRHTGQSMTTSRRHPRRPKVAPGRGRRLRRIVYRSVLATLGLTLLWVGANVAELAAGRRMLPWSAYGACGDSRPDVLPQTVRVGLYEEFPNPWRLARLRLIDFPITLAIAAPSRAAFLALREEILRDFPQVREVYFWPLLSYDEGYYPGSWSSADGVERVAGEAAGLPVLWDLELPLGKTKPSVTNWPRNRAFLDSWLRARTEPVHIWRSHNTMGLDPLFLRMAGLHFDPLDYPAVSLHLDLYAKGAGLPTDQMARILRCGVERYGARFIPSLGVLNDGEGSERIFVPPETLRRDLGLARAAGVSEVWLFGVNGLSAEYVVALREMLPLERLPDRRDT
jgi:hypothetical protein